MDHAAIRAKLSAEVNSVDAEGLLPHQRRQGLLMLAPERDLLDAAMAIATDQTETVRSLTGSGALYKPSLAQMADWVVDRSLRFQFVVVQPYVLAQQILRDDSTRGGDRG